MIIDPGPTATYCSRPHTATTVVDLRNKLAYALTPPPAGVCRWSYEPRAHLVVGGHALKVAPDHREARRGRKSSPGHCHEVFSRHRVDFGANLLLKRGFPQNKNQIARVRTEGDESGGRRGCEHIHSGLTWVRILTGSNAASHKKKYDRESISVSVGIQMAIIIYSFFYFILFYFGYYVCSHVVPMSQDLHDYVFNIPTTESTSH